MVQRNGIFISNNTILVLFIIGVLFFLLYGSAPQVPQVPQAPQAPQVDPVTIVQIENGAGTGDERYSRAPKPERDWIPYRGGDGRPKGLPSMLTQGYPEKYQAIGALNMEGGEILPLYGRRTTSRSDRFQYYTRTDTYNPVQLPIIYKRRDCQDDIGCDELFNGDRIRVGATGKSGEVTLYRFSGPTYYG